MHDALEPRLPHPPPRQLIVHERGPYFLTLVPVRVEHAKQRRPRARRRRPLVVLRAHASRRRSVRPVRPDALDALDHRVTAPVFLALDDALDGRVIARVVARARPRHRVVAPPAVVPARARRRRRRRRRRQSRALSTLAVLPRRSGRRRRRRRRRHFRARASAEPPATDAIDATPPRAARACAEGRRRR